MRSLNPFRVSFDGPLGPRERIRAQGAAIAVGCAALAVGATGLLALLNASSEAIGTWSNARAEPEVRIAASEAEAPSGKSCGEQVWPYIEAHCLDAAGLKAAVRSAPKHGPGSQQIALPAAPAETGTTGSATPDETPEPDRTAFVPIPAPAPEASAPSRSESVPVRREAKPRLSQREQRVQRERRQEARRLRAERQQARTEARRNTGRDLEDERVERQWSERTYSSSFGPTQRATVNRRGLFDDIFQTVR